MKVMNKCDGFLETKLIRMQNIFFVQKLNGIQYKLIPNVNRKLLITLMAPYKLN